MYTTYYYKLLKHISEEAVTRSNVLKIDILFSETRYMLIIKNND
jgi:hypothetical protein